MRTLRAFDVVGLDVLAVSVILVEPKIVPKTAPIVVEDEGFTAPVELLVAVVPGVW